MYLNREHIEKRILNILNYLDEKTLAFPLKENINIFSTMELQKLLEFLECGKLKIIYVLLDEKYKEYIGLVEEIKMIRINSKKDVKLSQENKERKIEMLELESLINF